MTVHFSHLGLILWLALKRLFNDKYTYHASALAYSTILALVPLGSVVVYSISFFPLFSRLIELTRGYIIANFTPATSVKIEDYLQAFINQATTSSSVGILFLFITTIMLILTIEDTLNEIWHSQSSKKTYTKWLFYWLVLLLSPLIIGVSILLSSYLFSLTWFNAFTETVKIKFLILSLLPILINTMFFGIIYIVIPRYPVKWRDGFLGGFIASILFEISKHAFGSYLKWSPSYEFIYGAFAAIPIFLVWIYIVWLIILYGAMVTHTNSKMRERKHQQFL